MIGTLILEMAGALVAFVIIVGLVKVVQNTLNKKDDDAS